MTLAAKRHKIQMSDPKGINLGRNSVQISDYASS
jgi:hypothetical protein